MCSTSRTNISPIRIITSHRSICCNQYLLKSNNSNKSCVQQSSTVKLFKYSSILYRRMFPISSSPCRMPRFQVCTGFLVSSKVPECIWRSLLIGANCLEVCAMFYMNQSLAVSILMYSFRDMQQCTQECRIWGESAHYTNGMS